MGIQKLCSNCKENFTFGEICRACKNAEIANAEGLALARRERFDFLLSGATWADSTYKPFDAKTAVIVHEFVESARSYGAAILLDRPLTDHGKSVLYSALTNEEVMQFADHITFDMIARCLSLDPPDAESMIDAILYSVGADRSSDGPAIKLHGRNPGDTGRLESMAPLPDKTAYLASFLDKFGNWRRPYRGVASSPRMHGGITGIECAECHNDPVRRQFCKHCDNKGITGYESGNIRPKRTDDPRIMYLQRVHAQDMREIEKQANRLANGYKAPIPAGVTKGKARKLKQKAKKKAGGTWANVR